MDNPRSCASPGLDVFLTAVAGARNPPSNDEFVATVFDECDPAGVAAFAAILLEYDPNQPRDWRGRWTTVGADDDSDSEAEIRRRLEKSLGGTAGTSADESAARADANSVIFGKRKLTPKDGSGPFETSFAGFDSKGNVLLQKDGGKPSVAYPQSFSDDGKQFLTDLAKLHDDEAFMAGLKAKPANVHIDSTGVKDADQLKWEAKVVGDIGMLSELETGRKVLDAAKGREDKITITAPRRYLMIIAPTAGPCTLTPAEPRGPRPPPAKTTGRRFSGLGRRYSTPWET